MENLIDYFYYWTQQMKDLIVIKSTSSSELNQGHLMEICVWFECRQHSETESGSLTIAPPPYSLSEFK